MKVLKVLTGYFDGKHIVFDQEPAPLPVNSRVKVIVSDDDDPCTSELSRAYGKLAEPVFQQIWDNPLDADYDKA